MTEGMGAIARSLPGPEVPHDLAINLPFELRKPLQFKLRGTHPGVTAEFARLLIDIDGRRAILQSTEKVGLGLPIEVSLLLLLDALRIEIAIALARFEDLVALRGEADLLFHLPMESLERRFPLIHPPLGKLPGPADLDPLADQQGIITIEEEKCNIGTIARHAENQADPGPTLNRQSSATIL
jgi:hypothetical protein